MSLSGERVLVTGATGFIGGRCVEMLVARGCRVRALVRNYATVPRITRLPIEMAYGSVTDSEAVARAAAECQRVIHAAMDFGGSGEQQLAHTVAGVQSVMGAAKKAGVQRVVHLSTISVYGMTADGDLSEASPAGRAYDPYCRSKAAGEKAAFALHRQLGVPLAVIQPTVVYGPFAMAWSAGPLGQLKSSRVVLPNDGSGLCNAVYVDDVADAILRAAVRPEAVGQRYLISASEPVTWKEFYGAYEEMLGLRTTIGMSDREFRAMARRNKRWTFIRTWASAVRSPSAQAAVNSTFLTRVLAKGPRAVARRLKRTLPRHVSHPLEGQPATATGDRAAELPINLPNANHFRWMATRSRVVIDKARRELGYDPKYDLRAGMERTRLWAQWARLLESRLPGGY